MADEFRDGNVFAAYDCYSSLRRSVEMLPDSVREVRFRVDAAAYNQGFLDTFRGGIQVRGRHIRVRYAIRADMMGPLRREIEKLAEAQWKPLRKVPRRG